MAVVTVSNSVMADKYVGAGGQSLVGICRSWY